MGLIPNPWLILALLLAWLASLAGVGVWQRHDGEAAERAAWIQRYNAQLTAANAQIKSLEEGARQAEQAHAQALSVLSTDYERKLSDANKQRALDHAAATAGTLRLRDPAAPGLRACGGIAPQIAAGAGGGDGRAPGELSPAAVGFLLDFANDADDIARQLAACQQVVSEDRAGR